MAHNTGKVMIAMKKARSLMEKVFKMLEENQYCIDVLQQNLAVIGLLRSANQSLLEGHINNCVKNATMSKNQKRLNELMAELSRVIKIAQTK